MKAALIGLVVIVLVVVVFGTQLIGERNSLVTEQNDIEGKAAQIDNDMKRRADLIPNLVETVKGFAKQEQTVFGDIANARASLLSAHSLPEKDAANTQLSGALGRLLVIQERYPELKSNENFLRLQDEISGTENRIAVDRTDYNRSVQKYNTDIQLFPKSLTASLFGFHRNNEYLKDTAEEKKVPQVKF